MSPDKIKVALLVGGVSQEKEVAKNTGKSVLKALRQIGYSVKVIDPGYGLNQPEDESKFFEPEDFAQKSTRNYIDALNSSMMDEIDVAFLALHGKWGEDGTVQSLLEMRNIKYTGSNVLASSLAMDKCMTKVMFQHHGVATPKWFLIENRMENPDKIKTSIIDITGYPCVIKPNDEGSTIGLTICKSEDQVPGAVEAAFKFSKRVLVEEYIPGRELTVAVIGDKALPVLEIKPKSGFYDYENKYTAGKTEYIVPADIPVEVSDHLRSQALLAFHSVGCESYSRIDFRMTDDYKSYCLEINTLPGMTSTSLVPKMAQAAGISFEELIGDIIQRALRC